VTAEERNNEEISNFSGRSMIGPATSQAGQKYFTLPLNLNKNIFSNSFGPYLALRRDCASNVWRSGSQRLSTP
jgi:hypothetical protein